MTALLFGALVPVVRAGESSVGADLVRWQDGLEEIGRSAAAALPSARRHVATRLGWRDDPRALSVTVVSGLHAMRDEARAQVPEWAVGIAQSHRSQIVIRADLLAQGFGGGLVATLRHELVHLAWGRRAGSRHREIPLWLEEGIAEEIGGGMSVDFGEALDLAVLGDRLIPFDTLATSFPAEARRADLAYKQSRSWVQHFVERRSWDDLREILLDVADARAAPAGPGDTTFAAAVRARSGRGVGEWHAAWQRAAKEASRPWFHLLFSDLGGLLLMAAALVAALSFFGIRARRRRQIAALDAGPEMPAAADGTE